MTTIGDLSMNSVDQLDQFVKKQLNDVGTVKEGKGPPPTNSPLIRKAGTLFEPSPEVLGYIGQIAGISITSIPSRIRNDVHNILENLNNMCSNLVSQKSKEQCDEFMKNMNEIFDLEIDLAKTLRGKIRKDTSLGIVEKQQFSDIWGNYVLTEAKKNTSVCYLCGLPIVPQAPPEMEHKIPSPVMFTTMMHYRQMTMFYANDPNTSTSQDSVYTRWHNFINNADIRYPIKLLKLYKLINGGHPSDITPDDYPKDGIDNLFNEIFEAFLPYIPYIVNKRKEDFFRYLIKYWLLEFAYSHHLCNQAKSDLPICHTTETKYYNAFSTSVRNRLKNKEKDSKTEQESKIIGNKFVVNITSRKNRTCAMFAHMQDTRKLALDEYTNISQVFDSSCNGYQKMISVMVVRSMLALLKRNDIAAESSSSAQGAIMAQSMDSSPQKPSSSSSSSPSSGRDDELGERTLEEIGTLKIEIDELENEIVELKEKKNKTRKTETELKKKETELEEKETELEEKETELEKKQQQYEKLHEKVNNINDNEERSFLNTIKQKLGSVIAGCVISGGKRRNTRRRRMGKRSKARRSYRKKKKTRKRRARKMVSKRRKKV